MKKALSTVFAIVMALSLFTFAVGVEPASAKVYQLVVQNHDPATSICGQYVEAWGSKVEAEAKGKIKFIYYHGGSLVGAPGSVDAVANGTADLCWSAATIYSGQFPISEFIQLPLSGITCARMGSAVFMDMLREIPELQAEYEDYYVVQLSACTYAPISTTKKKLKTIDDMKGLRIRAPGSTCALWATAIGASPMTVATPETYESLEKEVIEGCLNDWHNVAAFKLTDVITYIMDYPTPGSPLFILMNKNKYEKLPKDLQAAIDKYSGDYASKMAGIYWDSTRAWVYDKQKELKVEIYKPSSDLVTKFGSVKDRVHAGYIEYLNKKGFNGKAIYGKCMEIVGRYTDQYADPWAEPVTIDGFKG